MLINIRLPEQLTLDDFAERAGRRGWRCRERVKELRPRKMPDGRTYRILFVFDPQSRAITLVAGDKAGNWEKWYRKNVPVADAHYDEHLAMLAARQNRRPKRRKR